MKNQKWMVYLLAGMLTAETIGAGTGSAGVVSVYAAEATVLDARAYVELLCSGEASELEEQYSYTEAFLSGMESMGGFEGLQTSLKGLGSLQETEDPIVFQNGEYTAYSVPCQFAAMKLNIVINMDDEGKIAGVVTAEYDSGSAKEAEALDGITEMELELPVSGQEDWELPGTLTMPEGEGPFPAVVLVHGSGPNDRDETIGPNKPFRDLAQGLAQRGIAVYRYEKRTKAYGAEMAKDTTLTLYEETIQDAGNAVSLLRQQEKIDATQVYVLGHSLGGESLPRIDEALKEGERAAGYIFMAAPARRLSELMREQYDFLYSLMPELSQEEAVQKDAVYAELDKLENMDEIGEDEAVLGAYKAYWEDLESYDPVKEAADMTARCLVLQGEEDYQVTMEDYTMWKEAYENAENWKFISYPGLTHLFMEGNLKNGNADYMKQQNVDERVLSDIADFITKN